MLIGQGLNEEIFAIDTHGSTLMEETREKGNPY